MKNVMMLQSLIIAAVGGGEFSNESYNEYFFDEDVNVCQIETYLRIIELLEEYSEDEILSAIDSLDTESYKKLTKEKQKFIKEDIKKILTLRKGRINYE